jgi:hypothetical protein
MGNAASSLGPLMPIFRYSCRMNEYLYDIEIGHTTRLVSAERFSARAVNIVRLESGEAVPVNANLPSAYGQRPSSREPWCSTGVPAAGSLVPGRTWRHVVEGGTHQAPPFKWAAISASWFSDRISRATQSMSLSSILLIED